MEAILSACKVSGRIRVTRNIFSIPERKRYWRKQRRGSESIR
jgi:hypothetical protein